MAKTAVSQWDTTANNNTDINGISLAENVMQPPAVNDALREMMAQIKAGVFLQIAATSSVAAGFQLAEATSNGTNKVTVSAPTSLSADRTVTFPDKSGTALLDADVAAASDFRANTADKVLDADGVWGAAAEVALADAATIAVDMSTFLNATVTLGGNRTLGQPSSVKVGQSGVIRIVQDGTGSRTLSYHADWEFAGGAAPSLSAAAASNDLLFYQVLANGRIFASLIKGVA